MCLMSVVCTHVPVCPFGQGWGSVVCLGLLCPRVPVLGVWAAGLGGGPGVHAAGGQGGLVAYVTWPAWACSALSPHALSSPRVPGFQRRYGLLGALGLVMA